MEMQNPLDQLRPNHLPDPVSFWPPAPGWWISAILLALLLVFLTRYFNNRIRKNRYRKQAQRQAQVIMDSYREHQNSYRFAQDCNRLLKRTALQAYPQENIAKLHGQHWQSFLAEKSGNQGFLQGPGSALGESLYHGARNGGQTVEVDALHSMTLSWIRKHHA